MNSSNSELTSVELEFTASSRRLAVGVKTASDLHRNWCAILGLNQSRPIYDTNAACCGWFSRKAGGYGRRRSRTRHLEPANVAVAANLTPASPQHTRGLRDPPRKQHGPILNAYKTPQLTRRHAV